VNPLLPAAALLLCAIGLIGGMALMRSIPEGAQRIIPQDDADRRPSALARMRLWLAARYGAAFLRGMGESRVATVRHRIDAAGRPGGITLERYGGMKAAATILFGSLGAITGLFLGQLPLFTVTGLLFGWLEPDLSLLSQARRRQARIDRDLPDFLDVLTVTISAGLSFRNAMARVGEALGGPMGQEVKIALAQMRYGAPRRTALEAIRDRNDSESLAQFISALLQAEELGSPLADAMADISEDMRRAFDQRARRDAQRAVPRVSLIITMLAVPAVLVLVLGALWVGADVDLSLFGGFGG